MPEKTKIHLKSNQPQSLKASVHQKQSQQLKGKDGSNSNASKQTSEPSSSKSKRVKDVKSQNAKVLRVGNCPTKLHGIIASKICTII
jgi:hypothetical protein